VLGGRIVDGWIISELDGKAEGPEVAEEAIFAIEPADAGMVHREVLPDDLLDDPTMAGLGLAKADEHGVQALELSHSDVVEGFADSPVVEPDLISKPDFIGRDRIVTSSDDVFGLAPAHVAVGITKRRASTDVDLVDTVRLVSVMMVHDDDHVDLLGGSNWGLNALRRVAADDWNGLQGAYRTKIENSPSWLIADWTG
jgi:hypothetical protein